ncbi:nuclear transport factor 2 family protein [Rhodopseudomonas sp. NSM]|uniref:nuclear transport factor 2 family protein n=1 Tax=Rhodopseudomonas sp. NSM TaxID=3457630 RepID=UPI00403515ED
MSDHTYALAAASQRTIAGWHQALPTGDADALRKLLSEQVTFHSPAVQSPIQGRDASLLVVVAVASVLDNLRYRRTFVAGPCEAALEFSADIGQLHLTGIDLMRLGEDGLIEEFEVMIRPLKALSAVAEAVGSRIGPRLLEMKLKPDPG